MMWKQIDNDILSAELPVLFPGEKNHPTVPLQSMPDLEEHPFRDMEKQFLAFAIHCCKLLRQWAAVSFLYKHYSPVLFSQQAK